jgi:hypothetical protein
VDELGSLPNKSIEELGMTTGKPPVLSVNPHVPALLAYDQMARQQVGARGGRRGWPGVWGPLKGGRGWGQDVLVAPGRCRWMERDGMNGPRARRVPSAYQWRAQPFEGCGAMGAGLGNGRIGAKGPALSTRCGKGPSGGHSQPRGMHRGCPAPLFAEAPYLQHAAAGVELQKCNRLF